jgi:hypothetical protein
VNLLRGEADPTQENNPMGCMKSILIDRLDDDEVFRLAFELDEDSRQEPELPDTADSFTFTPSTHHHRSYPDATPVPI